MAADGPVVVYGKKKKDRRNADGSKRHTAEEMDRLWDEWVERKKTEGSMVGKKIDLGEWMRGEV